MAPNIDPTLAVGIGVGATILATFLLVPLFRAATLIAGAVLMIASYVQGGVLRLLALGELVWIQVLADRPFSAGAAIGMVLVFLVLGSLRK